MSDLDSTNLSIGPAIVVYFMYKLLNVKINNNCQLSNAIIYDSQWLKGVQGATKFYLYIVSITLNFKEQ